MDPSRYLLFLVTFFVVKYFTLFTYYSTKFIKGVLRASSDVYHEYSTKYVYLRPSEIRFNSDHISKIATKTWDGSETTIFDELKDVIWRRKTIRSISRKIVVVKRKDGRGFNENRKLSDPRKLPGWWVVEGNELLWVLQTLQKLKMMEYGEVRFMSAISDEMWYALSSVTKESDGGKEVSLNSGSIADKEELNVQMETILNDYKKHIAPYWKRMYSVPMSNLRLRLSDYETPTEPRSTHSCIGICHSTKRDEEREKNLYFSQDEMDEDHKCRRPASTMYTQKTPIYKSTYDGHIEWAPFIWGFIVLLVVGVLGGCCLKGCGCLVGRALLRSTEVLEEETKQNLAK